ncbi:hypothetical protein BB559_003168 [Furculomyces boomerangus]|uniref:Dolichyl-phosphate-mannose--protein mannosyltransferase n=1 Tax=Furculomyces boomerangus TaxID=61424 RepID=A0A2T9YN69_9FUNG|nr:hypothetical protein BB559_003168 [Furculomyces boomerangus]
MHSKNTSPTPQKKPKTWFQTAKSKLLNENCSITKEEPIDYAILALLSLLSAFTRLYQIGKRSSVTWDESHFGKFGAFYINHTFYHDVHPPLAKMLVSLAEAVAGHNGTFEFKGKYPEYLNFTLMRMQIAGYGILIIPMAYLTLLNLGVSRKYSLLGAWFVLFDNALCLMSRFILLDAPLFFFTAASLLSLVKFQKYKTMPFSKPWWTWLFLTGVSLGCVTSSKWVGLFCVALAGLYTIEDLFDLLDFKPSFSLKTYTYHWLARILGLIVIPVVIYMISFKIHFDLLYKSGAGDKRLPIQYQASLDGNLHQLQQGGLAYGSNSSIYAINETPIFLNPNKSRFPKGTKNHRVTGFRNNLPGDSWIIEPTHPLGEDRGIVYLKNGDLIKLRSHFLNHTLLFNINLHKKKPEMGEVHVFNKTGLTVPDIGSDVWRIHIIEERMVSGPIEDSKDKIWPVSTVVAFENVRSDCFLRGTNDVISNYGRNIHRIICEKAPHMKEYIEKSKGNHLLPKKFGEGYQWIFVFHKHNKMSDKSIKIVTKKPSFFKLFVFINQLMFKTNNGLIPDPDRYKVIESSPISWPFLIYPMRAVSWDAKSIKYYEIGNPILWWASGFCALTFPFLVVIWHIIAKRHDPLNKNKFKPTKAALFDIFWNGSVSAHSKLAQKDHYPLIKDEKIDSTMNNSSDVSFDSLSQTKECLSSSGVYGMLGCKLLFVGWALHYLPSFLMGRVTYIHHYLPALYFGLLLVAYELDYFTRLVGRKWLPTWDIYELNHKM